MNEVRWGLIGVGEVVRLKSGGAFGAVPGSRVVGVACRSGKKARAFAAEAGLARGYENAQELIEDPEVNAVYVATAHDSHEAYTLLAARHGKAVYVEKPMGRTNAECRRMLDACRAAGVPLYVAYYRRALPKFLKIKELIDAGAIGRPRAVSMTVMTPPRAVDLDRDNPAWPPWRTRPEIAGLAGYFMDMIPHQLDLLDFYLGPVAEASGHRANLSRLYPADDTVCAALRFENGALGSGTWSFTTDKSSQTDRTEIIGDKGTIIFSTFDAAPVRLITSSGEERFEFTMPALIQQPMIEQVVAALLGRGECSCPGEVGARTNRVIDQILGTPL